MADDATVELLDCSAECHAVNVPLDNFLDGTRRPYGGDRTLIGIQVTNGRITAIVEQYLP